MRRSLLAMAACGGLALLGTDVLHLEAARRQDSSSRSHALPPRAAPSRTTSSASTSTRVPADRTLLDRYCISCHNDRLRTAGLSLQTIDLAQVGEDASVWEKVVRKVRAGAMPPSGQRRPDTATAQAFVASLETALDRAAVLAPNPGRTGPHRLNRTEYGSAVRDLLGLEIDDRALLPADDQDHGFDNMADVLSVSPTLIEQYMSAAQRITQLAVGDPAIKPVFETYAVPDRFVQDDRVSDDVPFGSRGGVAIRHHFPLDGDYVIRIRLRRTLYHYIRGIGVQQRLDVRLDGSRIKILTIGGEYKGQLPPASYSGDVVGDPAWEEYSHRADDGLEVHFPAKAGPRVVTVSFEKTLAEPEGFLQPPADLSTFNYAVDEMADGNAAVATVTIEGPFNASGAADTASRRKIFVCRPASSRPEEETRCATKILSTMARRAYRRPVTVLDIETLLGFYTSGRREGSFDAGIQTALQRLLVSPHFLFRIERDPVGAAPGSVYRLNDLEVASRLSFFLWSSIPDDELLEVAARGQLKNSDVLQRQMRRMTADARARTLVSNFAAQWLELRHMRAVAPDPTLFPAFDENLREAMQQETELFLESQLRDDRSVVDVLRANYTFLNQRLAEHYGIPGVYGAHFRRVPLNDDRRAGLMGHASLLTITSYANRTSPVLRGKWLLENVLGAPPPPPPPNVPSLPERRDGETPRSVRDRLELHRKNPVCASCHASIDPLGFALENYDAIGRWRTHDAATEFDRGLPVDSTGTLLDGTKMDGPAALRNVLLSRQDQFVTTVTEKLLMYALGRGLEYYDMPAVRQIMQSAAPDYRWSALILGIVKSTPFQMRRSPS